MEVIRLTPETAGEHNKDVLNSGNYKCFVKVYSPSCGHCQAMQPAWDELENLAGSLNASGKIVSLHSAVQDEYKPKFEIQGYPTLLIINEDGTKDIEYEGDRSAGDLKSFIEKHLGGCM